MNKLQKAIKKIREFDLYESFNEAIENNEAEITDLNIAQHREKGVYNTGIEISSIFEYAPLTIELKRAEGKLTNNNPDIINLHDDGDFHRGFEINILSRNNWEIDSDDNKTEELKDNWESGDNKLFGLTNENQQEANNIILEDIRERIQKLKKSI